MDNQVTIRSTTGTFCKQSQTPGNPVSQIFPGEKKGRGRKAETLERFPKEGEKEPTGEFFFADRWRIRWRRLIGRRID